jgi:hypothetical protein
MGPFSQTRLVEQVQSQNPNRLPRWSLKKEPPWLGKGRTVQGLIAWQSEKVLQLKSKSYVDRVHMVNVELSTSSVRTSALNLSNIDGACSGFCWFGQVKKF